jgi:hypothetical protein
MGENRIKWWQAALCGAALGSALTASYFVGKPTLEEEVNAVQVTLPLNDTPMYFAQTPNVPGFILYPNKDLFNSFCGRFSHIKLEFPGTAIDGVFEYELRKDATTVPIGTFSDLVPKKMELQIYGKDKKSKEYYLIYKGIINLKPEKTQQSRHNMT